MREKEIDKMRMSPIKIRFWDLFDVCRVVAAICVGSAVNAMTYDELAAAIDVVEPGGTVYVDSDVECAEPLMIDKELTIRSAPGAAGRLVRAQGASKVIVTGQDGNLTLLDIVIDGNPAAGAYGGRLLSITNGVVNLGAGATIANGKGCAVEVTRQGVFNMLEGSAITNFVVGTGCYGIAVLVGHNGTTYADSGKFNMSGGVISGCSAAAAPSTEVGKGQWDGAVYMYGGTLNATGGVITDNRSKNCVAGVIAYAGAVNLSGSFTATNNIGGFANDFFFDTNRTSSARVIMNGDYTGHMTFKYSYVGGPSDGDVPQFIWTATAHTKLKGWQSCESQDEPSLALDYSKLTGAWYPTWRRIKTRIVGKGNEFSITDALADAVSGDIIEVLSDHDVSSTISVSTDVTVRSAPGVKCSFNRLTGCTDLFSVPGANVVFADIILDGSNIEPSSSFNCGLVNVKSGATVTLGAGAELRNAAVTAYGAAAIIRNSGSKLVMEDGALITGCRSTATAPYGAAIMVGGGSVETVPPCFEMRGGSITACDVSSCTSQNDSYGGVVYLWNGVMDMSGGTITNNSGFSRSSSAVVNYSGTMRISGSAVIDGNEGSRSGIYNRGTSTTVWYGDFRGRTAISSGEQTLGSAIGVTREGEATGAWCFMSASGSYVGKMDGGNAVWAEPVGSVGPARAATVEDLAVILPSSLDLDDAATAAGLPLVLGGAAAEFSGTFAISFDRAAMLASGRLPLAVLKAADGQTLSGTWTWTFQTPPRERGGTWAVCSHDGGATCVLEWHPRGFSMSLR